MGEHKDNPRALLADSIPPLLPVGCRVAVDIQLQVMPKVNVMLAPAAKMRTTAEGHIEVLAPDGSWKPAPAGVDVCELGKPLPPEKCDVVAILGATVEDVLGPKLLQPGEQQPRGRVSTGPMGILMRVPLDKWQASHLNALRGPVE